MKGHDGDEPQCFFCVGRVSSVAALVPHIRRSLRLSRRVEDQGPVTRIEPALRVGFLSDFVCLLLDTTEATSQSRTHLFSVSFEEVDECRRIRCRWRRFDVTQQHFRSTSQLYTVLTLRHCLCRREYLKLAHVSKKTFRMFGKFRSPPPCSCFSLSTSNALKAPDSRQPRPRQPTPTDPNNTRPV